MQPVFPDSPNTGTSWPRDNITGLMLVTALLAVIFGVPGVWNINGAKPEIVSGFLDIAKLFAGALVGAAGAVGVSVAATKK